MKLSFNKYGWIALLGAGLVSSPAATVGISVDTSNLLFGTYALQFQLTNGNAAGVNSVTLSGFNFGGGSPSGAPALIGGASGNLSSTVTLVDNAGFLSLFTQGFTPGSALSFTINATTNFVSGAPDFFGMAILHNGSPLPTTDPSTTNQFVAISLQAPFTVGVFGTINDPDVPFVPTPTPGGSGVPEPATYLSVLPALAWLLHRSRRA